MPLRSRRPWCLSAYTVRYPTTKRRISCYADDSGRRLHREGELLHADRLATIERCEELLLELELHDSPANHDLLMASNFDLAHCGGAVALVQLVISWARVAAEASRLRIHGESGLKRMVGSLPGLAAVLMAGDVNPAGHERSLLKAAYALAKERISIMDAGALSQTAKGLGVQLLCADETSMRALLPFYHRGAHGSGELRGEADFIDLAHRILDSSIASSRRRRLTSGDAEAIGVMLRELFSNTHLHARKDAMGTPYRKSVRGLFASHHSVGPDNISDLASGYVPLRGYLEAIVSDSNRLQLFELSVFDSGPGYAARLAGRPMTEADELASEYDLVRRCFLRHVTSRTTTGAGAGLARMLQRLKAHRGFLRLRTGRLSLFQSFGEAEGVQLLEQDLDLRDARVGNQITRHANAAGTVLTLLVPLSQI